MRRRTFLAGAASAGAGALGLAACTTSRPAPRPSTTGILGLSFTVASSYRPFDLVAPQFVAVTSQSAGYGELVLSSQGPPVPYAAVELELTRGGRSASVLGLAKSTGEHLLASYDHSGQRVGMTSPKEMREAPDLKN